MILNHAAVLTVIGGRAFSTAAWPKPSFISTEKGTPPFTAEDFPQLLTNTSVPCPTPATAASILLVQATAVFILLGDISSLCKARRPVSGWKP